MPELPEVETVCRTLRQLVIGKTIDQVEVRLNRIVRRPENPSDFCRLLQGQTFVDVQRRGKFIKLITQDRVLVSHLRMEGRYGLFQHDEQVEKHTHVLFTFTDGSQLRYKDVRQFGTMDLFDIGEELTASPLSQLGLEPLDESFTFECFKLALQHKTTKIKPLLLNQSCIVGLGNIYVDEALFTAAIHPETPANHLKKKQLLQLHQAIVDTLRHAVEAGGSSIKSYVNGQGEMGMFQQKLKVYGKKDQPCPACSQPIERFVVGGRGTHICPKCQKLPILANKKIPLISS